MLMIWRSNHGTDFNLAILKTTYEIESILDNEQAGRKYAGFITHLSPCIFRDKKFRLLYPPI